MNHLRATTKTALLLILALAGIPAWSSSTRSIDADAFKSSDHTKTFTLPAATGTLLNQGSNTAALAALNIDWSLALPYGNGYLYTKTLSASSTLTFSNVVTGQVITIAITNTASNYTVTWPGAAKWPGGSAPTQTIGAHTDVYTCVSYDGTNAYCNAVQNY